MRSLRIALLVLAAAAVCLGASPVNAMPMFARRLGVPCNTCHTTIPRLNEVGYKFRAAGYRMPEEIGKSSEQKFDLGNYFSARIQARYDTQVTNQPNGAPVPNLAPSGSGNPGPRTTTNAFSFMEGTLYPLTGSWGKYFGSLAEWSFSPEDFWEIENAYVRVAMGNEKNFFTSRIGVFHPWEGFGASDRPYSNARPLFQTIPISSGGRATPYVYQPWGLDEVGLEVGGDLNKLSLRVALLGGNFMRWEEGAANFLPFPSQTGPWKGANQAVPDLGKSFDQLSHSTPDWSANATYILNPNGGGLTFLYYHGNMATPYKCTDGTLIGATGPGGVCGVTPSTPANPFGTQANTDFDFSKAGSFRNNFNRYEVYASYPVKKILPQVGFNWGNDTNRPGFTCGTPAGPCKTFGSFGWFADGAYTISRHVTTGFRYDYFHPNNTPGTNNRQWAVTPYVNVALLNGAQIIGEYQHRDFQYRAGTPAGPHDRQNDTLQVRFIFIM